MIKTTLKEIHAAASVIEQLLQMEWPAKTSYHIAKLARLIQVEHKEYEKLRINLIKKIGVTRAATDDEKMAGHGDTIHYLKTTEQIEEFREKMREVEEIPVEISWEALLLDKLSDKLIPANVMHGMNDFILDDMESK